MTHTSIVGNTPLHTVWHQSIFVSCMAAMTLGFSLRIKGAQHVPPTGRALILSNHQSYLDPVLVGLALRRKFAALARKTLFRNRFFAALIRSMNAIPIDQEGVGKEGLAAIRRELECEQAVLVFPEGTRTPDGTMQPLKPGILLLLKRVQAPIVPVGIAGAYDAWPVWRKYPLPAPLCYPNCDRAIGVAVGPPIDSAPFAEMDRDQALAKLTSVLQGVFAEAKTVRRRF